MLTTIVVPLDGSKLSESALPVAAELARTFGATVYLMSSGWGSNVADLDGYLQSRGADLDVPGWSTGVVADSFPVTAIAGAVAGIDAAVVMATHGRSGLGKALLGSAAEDLLKATDRPVVLLGKATESKALIADGILIVSTDGSDTSVTIVDDAIAWATALRLSVRVVAVTRSDGTPVGGTVGEELPDRLETVADRVRAAGLHAQVQRVEADDAARALVDLARNLPATMIAMATHGRTGMARTALGSTAMKVVRDAPCPVLVHRPPI